MSDATPAADTAEDKKNVDPTAGVDYGRPDFFLQNLVGFANDIGIESPVTLHVGGFLVSGIVISGAKYFEEFSKIYGAGFADAELGREIAGSLATLKKIYDRSDKPDDPSPPPTYIHLKNCRMFHNSGGPVPNNGSVLWRGRLSCVDGFSLGTLDSN